MPLLVDTHVHLYNCYDLNLAFESAIKNFYSLLQQNQCSDVHLALCLTEKSGCHFFKRLAQDPKTLLSNKWQLENITSNVIKIKSDLQQDLYLIAGRQIATQERLEVLALGQDLDIADQQSLEVTCRSVIQQQAIPVIPWSFGKWWGKRGQVLRQLLDIARPNEIFLADSSLRAKCCSNPQLITQEINKGHKILAGTDPFPRLGEEKLIGSYATYFAGSFSTVDPVASIKNLLNSTDACQILGGRIGLLRMLIKAFNLP